MKEPRILRKSMTMEELLRVPRGELALMQLNDDEVPLVREIYALRARENEARALRLNKEEEPIVADLKNVGCDVESVWDLVNRPNDYAAAIPVLLKHLLLPYSDRNIEGIARSLAVPDKLVRAAWPVLVELYRKAPQGQGIVAPGDSEELRLGAKDGLACALSVAVTDETLPELISLAKDRTNGESRILLLGPLRKRRTKSQQASQAIEELANDPELVKEIASWNKRLPQDRLQASSE